MRCGTPTITWSQWISMPIAQRREASKGCGCRHSIGGARACSTSHEWGGSPPTGPSASTPKTFGKYRLNFPAIFSAESRNRRGEVHILAGNRRAEGGRRVLFYSGHDPHAKAEVGALIAAVILIACGVARSAISLGSSMPIGGVRV